MPVTKPLHFRALAGSALNQDMPCLFLDLRPSRLFININQHLRDLRGEPLVDMLLTRGINGESPVTVKKRIPRKLALTPKPHPPTRHRGRQG